MVATGTTTLTAYFKAVDQMSGVFQNMATAGENVVHQYENMENRANSAFDNINTGASDVSSSMKGMGADIQQPTAAIDGLRESTDKAGDELGEYADESKKASESSEQLGQSTKQVAVGLEDILKAVGVIAMIKATTAAFKECVGASGEYESALAAVSTIADPAKASMQEISDDLMDISERTGQSATELANATYQAISASVATEKAAAFAETANRLAVAGFTSTTTAVDVLTTAINAYGMSADDAAMISDRLVETQNLGKTTVDELAATMGRIIPTAAAFGVSLDNLSTSYAVLTANGIQTAQATTYMSGMFTELSKDESDVNEALHELTGKGFKELMEMGYSVGDVLQMLGEYCGGDSVAFANMWGSIEAGKGALSIFNSGAEHFNEILGKMQESTGMTAEGFEKMAGTAEYSFNKMHNNIQNLKIAVGETLEPTLQRGAELGTKLASALEHFVKDNPTAVKALASLTVGLTALVTALTAAKVAQLALNLAMAANPYTLALGTLSALVVAIGVYELSCNDASEASNALTIESQELQDSIDKQEQKVEELTKRYGENSDEVIKAKVDLQELQQQMDETGETIGDLCNKIDEHNNKFRESQETYKENMSAIRDNETETLMLVEKLERLNSASTQTEDTLGAQAAIVEELKSKLPDAGIEYDKLTNKLNLSADALKKYAKEQADAAAKEAKWNKYVQDLENEKTLDEDLTKARKELTAAEEKLNEAMERRAAFSNDPAGTLFSDPLGLAQSDADKEIEEYMSLVGELTQKVNEVEAAHNEAKASVDEYAATLDESQRKAEEAAAAQGESMEAGTQAVISAIDEQKAMWESLNEEYAEAIVSAKSAAEQVASTWEELKAKSDTDSKDMTDAWKNHADYFKEYADNIKKAKEAGFDPAVIAQFTSGTEEAAGALKNLVDEYEKAGEGAKGSKEKQEELVNSVNEGYAEMQTSIDEWSKTVADAATNFTQRSQEIINKIGEVVGSFDKSSEAGAAAKAMMDAYQKQIQDGIDAAVKLAQAGAKKVADALNAATSTAPTPKHAAGTTYGEDVYIAGEQGAELILNRRGSEVFPASETNRIIAAIKSEAADKGLVAVPENAGTAKVSSVNSTRDINVNFGGGKLKITGAMSKTQVVGQIREYIADNLESVIVDAIMTEKFEEGMGSYAF